MQTPITDRVTPLDETKARILVAAGEEFAAHGFDRATVRAICRRAGVNLAAVNYHFGDKEQLYRAAVLEAHRCGIDEPDDKALEGLDATERLRAFVAHFLSRVLAIDPGGSWQQDLMLREMLRPSRACEWLVDSAIRPRYHRLRAILAELEPSADERQRTALCFSVIGQCLFYKTTRAVTERLIGAPAFAELTHDFLTDHITRVTLAAAGRPCAVVSSTSGSQAP
jgi:AcrR family transcriptional regulator